MPAMIAIRPTEEEREQYVQNILDAWNDATGQDLIEGHNWYPTAHQVADLMSEGNIVAGAGVIAALSAQKNWVDNQRLAEDALNGDVHGHTKDTLRKVERILLGEDPEDVLPMSMKTGMFYRCILDPEDPDAVVIDRHAHDIAVGEVYGNDERGLGSKQRYAVLAHCYREAALRLGELPSTVQAVTWVRQRRLLAGTSTRGSN